MAGALSASSLHQDSGTFSLSGADWAVANSSWTLTRRASGGSTIALTNIGSAVQHTAPAGAGNFVLNYTDGPSGSGSATGIVYVTASTFATGNGIQITLPADTTVRTATIYWGASGTTARLTATLSDGSASAQTHTVTGATDAQNFGFISTVTYQAGSASQTLTVKLTTDVTVDGQDEIAFQGVAYSVVSAASAISTLGALASVSSATIGKTGVGVSTLGAIATQAAAVLTAATIAASSLGGLSSSLTASETRTAAASSSLGMLSSYASVQPPNIAIVSSILGGLASTATATIGPTALAPPVIFPVSAEVRIFGASAEQRTFGVGREVRLFGAAE